MRLPENPSKITRKTYTGQKDDEGRPHGHGTMEYSAESKRDTSTRGISSMESAQATECGMRTSVSSANMSRGSGRRWEITTAQAD